MGTAEEGSREGTQGEQALRELRVLQPKELRVRLLGCGDEGHGYVSEMEVAYEDND